MADSASTSPLEPKATLPIEFVDYEVPTQLIEHLAFFDKLMLQARLPAYHRYLELDTEDCVISITLTWKEVLSLKLNLSSFDLILLSSVGCEHKYYTDISECAGALLGKFRR